MANELDRLAREVEQLEASTEGMANIAAIYFNKLVQEGLLRDEALQLTQIFVDNTTAIFRGGNRE